MLVGWAFLVLALCLGGFAQERGESNWVGRKLTHLAETPQLTGDDVDYFANQVRNEGNFRKHLDNILVPRVPGTSGSDAVREVRESIHGDGDFLLYCTRLETAFSALATELKLMSEREAVTSLLPFSTSCARCAACAGRWT